MLQNMFLYSSDVQTITIFITGIRNRAYDQAKVNVSHHIQYVNQSKTYHHVAPQHRSWNEPQNVFVDKSNCKRLYKMRKQSETAYIKYVAHVIRHTKFSQPLLRQLANRCLLRNCTTYIREHSNQYIFYCFFYPKNVTDITQARARAFVASPNLNER